MNLQTGAHADASGRHHDCIARAWHTDAWNTAYTLRPDEAFTRNQKVCGGGRVTRAVTPRHETRESALHNDTSVYK